jgi:CTP-dependent riboflavin kinase
MPRYLPHLYPGTLNITLVQPRPKINWAQTYRTDINGKPLYVHPCRINGIKGYMIAPPMATSKNPKKDVKNPYLIELGHEQKLRDILNLKDGDNVRVEIDFVSPKRTS